MISNIYLLCCVVLCAGGGFEEDCGLEEIFSQPMVRGGMRVRSREFPWHVAIFSKNFGDNFGQICGGSLVRSQLVITAAHCFSMKGDNHTVDLSAYRVVGGSLNSTWTTEDLEGRQQSEVRAVRLGGNYGAHVRNFQDDIAIVHLQTEFIFSPVVRAVCLDLVDRELHNTHISPGSVGKVAGWGLTESGSTSAELNFLNIPVVGNTQCYRSMRWSFKAYITSDKFCAGLTNGSAMCPGDSGGGLVFPLPDTNLKLPRWYLRGVLSNGPKSDDPINIECQTKYLTTYTNILSHKGWLSTNMDQLQPQRTCRARGSVGTCRDFINCPAAMEAASHGLLPVHCSPSSSKICCVMPVKTTCPPTVSQRRTGSKAQDYCLDLPERLYPCQQNGSRGDLCGPEPEKHNPGYSMLPFTSSSGSRLYGFVPEWRRSLVYMGVTLDWIEAPVFLVSERWLLVRASGVNIMLMWPAKNITFTPEVVFIISRVVLHPQHIYGYSITENDIALLEMDRPVPFSRRYRPVCLHTPQDSVAEGELSRWRWGGNRLPATILSQEECRREFPPGRRAGPGGATASHLCTSSSSNEENCKSYYLMANNGHRAACTQLLVGMYLDYKAKGPNCSTLYLRLSFYTPWVESVVWP